MFCEHLEALIAVSGISSSSELARYIGCDRSYISKLRHGRNTIYPDSRAAVRLLEGLYGCAEANGGLKAAAELVGADGDIDEDSLMRAMSDYLFEGIEHRERTAQKKRNNKHDNAVQFGKKLNDVIEIADISNIKLAQLSNVDASIISRYRRGQRSAKPNSSALESVCRELVDRIYAKRNQDELFSLIGIEPAEDKAFVCDRLMLWMCDYDSGKNPAINELIRDIGAFRKAAQSELPLWIEPDINESTDIYIGKDGLKECALRFLVNVIRAGVKEICLYSDQEMDWLSGDTVYAQKWAGLMAECIAQGTRIKIIHNVDRRIEEMTDAIRKWLPMYMTGQIEGSYSTLSAGSRFSHTVFLAHGVGCVASCCPKGGENDAVYQYISDKTELDCAERLYDIMFEKCRPLVRISHTNDDDHGGETAEFKDVRIIMRDDGVTVRRLFEPKFDFNITHPQLRAAFEVYLKKNR